MVSSWIGGNGSWFDPANWSTGVVPDASDTVEIDTAGDIVIDAGSNEIEAAVASAFTLDFDTVQVSGGTLATSGAAVLNGVTWIGPLVVSGGDTNLSIEGGLTLRPASGRGPGTLVVQGSIEAVPYGSYILPSTIFVRDRSAGQNVIYLASNNLYGSAVPTAAFGGGDGDVLFGNGRGTALVAGPGAETLFGSGSSEYLFAGPGTDVVVMGTSGETAYAGTGTASISAYGTGETVTFTPAQGGGAISITGFGPTLSDVLNVSAYGTAEAAAAAGSAQSANGSTVLTLTDGTRITLVGITSPTGITLR